MNPTELALYWQPHIERWRETGLSAASFCKQQTLSYHQFLYWRRKLEGADDVTDTERVPTSGFARVTQVATSSASGDLTLTLPGGMAITGLHAGNVDLLGAILRQL